MKRIAVTLLLISFALAQETIPFTDGNSMVLGPKLLVKPEIVVLKTAPDQSTNFSLNISNPGTVSFTQVNIYSDEPYVKRETGQLSLKKNEAKKIELSAQTNDSGIFITNVFVTAHETMAGVKIIILSGAEETVSVETDADTFNTLETINVRIQTSKNGTLYYGFISLEGELANMSNQQITPGTTSIPIKIPKEIVPNKYLLFASIDQESFDGVVVEIKTFIPLQALLIIGLITIGLGALIQAGIRKKEKLVK